MCVKFVHDELNPCAIYKRTQKMFNLSFLKNFIPGGLIISEQKNPELIMLCDFFFRLRAWEIHAKTGALASRSTIVMNTSVFVFQDILDSTAMVSLGCLTSQILCNQSRHNCVNLCHVWKLVKNLTQK